MNVNPKCKMQRMFCFAGLLGTWPPLKAKKDTKPLSMLDYTRHSGFHTLFGPHILILGAFILKENGKLLQIDGLR